ncbi:MAG: PAS domain-containing protein [Rubrivivax sp.]|nr:PAS domain-containing protein [Rubrivivax sp.]
MSTDRHPSPLEALGATGLPDTAPLPLQPAVTRLGGESKSLLALAVDLGHIAVWRHDLATHRVHCNDQACQVLGIEPRPQGLSLDEVRAFVHPEDLPQELASAQAALASDHPTDVEARYRRSDGSWRHVMTRRVVERDGQGKAQAFVGVALDLTERRNVELALRSATERAALAARGTGLGTWELDLQTGNAIWDEQMWTLRGRPPQPRAMVESERLACVHPDDLERVKRFLHETQVTGATVDKEFRVVWPDGTVRWLASRSLDLRDEASGARRRVGVNWDITDKHLAEAAGRERELAHRQNLAKSKFLSRMSHELRTPLNAVLGFSQLLLVDEKGVDEPAANARRRRLEQIRSAGQHLLSLIDDVLDLSSLEGGEMRITLQPVPLRELVAETLPMLAPLCDKHGVTVHSGEVGTTATADATRLRQVLLNLLTNAVKYNRAGGTVIIESLQRGTEVRIRVSDTGQGMSESQLAHLFEPFNRLGREGDASEGTGIGLAIVKALVEHMGGTLHVQSSVGEGSVFEVRLAAATAQAGTLPCAEQAAGEGALISSQAAAELRAPGPGRRLLYIEDNPTNALIIAELLARRSDLTLEVAVDGTRGVARARAMLPDLILLDMQLPDFDGFEVLRQLRQTPTTAAIPCIALSANAMPEDIQRALQAGLADYWTKPLDFAAFMASLEARFGPAP